MEEEKILIVDFDGQSNQLISKKVRECNVYSEIIPYNTPVEEIKEKSPKGIIFTGGPDSVYTPNNPTIDKRIFELGIPVLGICYGMQLMTNLLGGVVERSNKKEYVTTKVYINNNSKLFKGLLDENDCLMNYTDKVTILPTDFKNIGYTDSCQNAAMELEEKKLYGIQFLPEVSQTNRGTEIIRNFIFNVCDCHGSWKMCSFIENTVKQLKEKVGDKKVLYNLYSNVNSLVSAVLLNKAIGKNLTCVFVDNGLLRKNEADEVETAFSNIDVNFVRINAKTRFLEKLDKVTEPEEKRKIISEEFDRILEEEAKKLEVEDIFLQGSIEQLKDLLKSEVREVGLELGLPEYLVFNQPLPEAGLADRIIGEVTEEKINILQEADYIWRDEISKAGLDRNINQYFAVLIDLRCVETSDYCLALRAVENSDFATYNFSKIPYEILERVSNRIVKEVKNINRVVYDITNNK